MTKTLIAYPGLILGFVLMITLFVTTTSYTQLGIAILLYLPLAFFAYKILPLRKNPAVIKPAIAPPFEEIKEQTEDIKETKHVISDIDKRSFLKLIGATGISFFLVSIFGRRVESLLFGGQTTGNAQFPTTTSSPAPSPTDGYSISEVEDNLVSYYGFINKEGGWFIMKGDDDTGSFRYAKGESNFPDNWKKRHNLKYNYFYEVFL